MSTPPALLMGHGTFYLFMFETVVLLIVSSINNKLQQPEEAFGVLEYARKHHRADLVCLSLSLLHSCITWMVFCELRILNHQS